jgi:TctA family transporter
MLMSRGDPMVFLKELISLAFIIATVLIVVVMMAPAFRKQRSDITG